MTENKSLRVLYTVFLGVLIALFVGVGIATFYESPESPDYPPVSMSSDEGNLAAERALQAEYDKKYQAYQAELDDYNRNVSIVSLVVAVALIVVGLVFEWRIKMLAGAIMLGGIFTLLYSIGRGFATDDSRYVFVVLAISLVIVFYLGYSRFVRATALKKS